MYDRLLVDIYLGLSRSYQLVEQWAECLRELDEGVKQVRGTEEQIRLLVMRWNVLRRPS